jgi:hypothetical protein
MKVYSFAPVTRISVFGYPPPLIIHCFENGCAEGALECGGLTPPLRLPPLHSKALRAFSWFLGARQRTGMSDCFENTL